MSLRSQSTRRRQQYGTPSPNQFGRNKEADLFKLGSEKRPALLTVKDDKRQAALQDICKENGWHCEIEVDEDAEEDIADLEALQTPSEPVKVETVIGRNDPCTCGSGKKYKHCHGKK